MSSDDDVSRLYLALGRIDRALRREASEAPVGHGALSVLSTLTKQGPQRLGVLASVEGVSAPSMTRIVATLETLGHVVRQPDPEDGRASVLSATQSGRDLVLAGREARMAALRQRLDALSTRDRDLVDAALPVLEQLATPAAALPAPVSK